MLGWVDFSDKLGHSEELKLILKKKAIYFNVYYTKDIL